MTSTAQSHLNEIAAHHSQHQDQVPGNQPHAANSAHGIAATTGTASYTTDNHLAGLVEAATAAAGQNVGWAQPEDGETTMPGEARAIHNQLDGYGVGMQLDDGFGSQSNAAGHHFLQLSSHGGQVSGNGARQIVSASGPLPTAGDPSGRKRKRGNPNVDPAITANPPFVANGTSHNEGPVHEDGSHVKGLPLHVSNARAAGVHSAVALFRQPSATSKKYTRPPMSKLFASLELSPENFLHLQAAAKAYMLDDNHPERRDCVGQRGKGDTEMVRLRLWNCVSDFLDKEGNGPRFFGENIVNEGMGPRQMIWPRDDQKIISLMMPLLRRMVTNERQRQYAIESRKGGNGEEKKRKMAESPTARASSANAIQFEQSTNSESGILDILASGYPSDWESISQTYNSYNQDYRLDNLGSISGLSHPDWLSLVAAVDCHYQIDHHGDASECDQPCEDCMVNHIVSADSVSHASWRIGVQGDNHSARTYFASGITRDVSHIVKENLIQRANDQHSSKFTTPGPFPGQSSDSFSQGPNSHPVHRSSRQAESKLLGPVRILVNFVQNSNDKRSIPRLELQADQISCFAALLKNAQHYQQQRQQSPANQIPGSWRIKAWLKEGLTPIRNEEDWTAALIATHTMDWMDGELRIVIDEEAS